MVYRAIIFDLDGTLLNSLEDLATSMNQTLKLFGLPQHPVDAYRSFVGDGIETLIGRAAPHSQNDSELKRNLLNEMRNQYQIHWADQTRPYDGIPELLNSLTHRGLSISICSNKPQYFTLLCAQKLLTQWKFDRVYGVSDKIPPKPDPTAPLRVAEELGIGVEKFLYLGDTNTDMRAARAAKMIPVGVLWGFRSKAELLESGAKVLLKHPLQLLELIDT